MPSRPPVENANFVNTHVNTTADEHAERLKQIITLGRKNPHFAPSPSTTTEYNDTPERAKIVEVTANDTAESVRACAEAYPQLSQQEISWRFGVSQPTVSVHLRHDPLPAGWGGVRW
jgi:predicted XRE-type DNA-binding protein